MNKNLSKEQITQAITAAQSGDFTVTMSTPEGKKSMRTIQMISRYTVIGILSGRIWGPTTKQPKRFQCSVQIIYEPFREEGFFRKLVANTESLLTAQEVEKVIMQEGPAAPALSNLGYQKMIGQHGLIKYLTKG